MEVISWEFDQTTAREKMFVRFSQVFALSMSAIGRFNCAPWSGALKVYAAWSEMIKAHTAWSVALTFYASWSGQGSSIKKEL